MFNVAKYKVGDVVELLVDNTTHIGIILEIFQISKNFEDSEERYTRVEYRTLLQNKPQQPLWFFESEIIKKI